MRPRRFLTAALVLVGAVGLWRSLRPRPFLVAARAMLALPNPWTWVKDGWDRIRGISGELMKAIERMIEPLLSFLGVMIDVWGNLISSIYSYTTWVFSTLTSTINNAISGTWAWVNSLVVSLHAWVSSVVSGFVRDLYGFINVVQNVAMAGLNAVRSWASGMFDWFQRNVISPLWNAVQNLPSLVARMVDSALQTVTRWISTAVSNLTRWSMDRLNELWHLVDRIVMPVWDLLQRIWDWLLLIAKYPYSWFRQALDSVTGATPDLMERWVMTALAEHGSALEDWLMDWLE